MNSYYVQGWAFSAVTEMCCGKDEKCLLSKRCVFAGVGEAMLVCVGRLHCFSVAKLI